jgi:hypothetical protein
MADIYTENGGSGKIISSSYIVDSKPISDMVQDRVLPRQVSTGTMRGTQALGGDKVLIDSSNERVAVGKLANLDDYAVKLTREGLVITDGTTVFMSITKDGIVMNDGTTDRVLIGKDEGGF